MAAETKGVDEEEAKVLTAAEEDRKLGEPMVLAQLRFRLSLDAAVVGDMEEVKGQAMKMIVENEMAPFYESMCAELGWTADAALLADLKAKNEAHLKKLNAKIEDAKLNHGETEVLDSTIAVADYYAQIGAKDKAIEIYLKEKKEKQSIGQRIDMVLKSIRLCLIHGDMKHAKRHIETGLELVEKGGDWDRRNRLKVYQGTYFLASRDFTKAAKLFLDSVATFTCYEMYDYNTFVFYLVVVALLSFDRPILRARVVEAPEVLTCIRELPHAEKVLTSFYNGEYKKFFEGLVEMHPHILRDRLLAPHGKWYLREVRIKAYAQFLESYKSVTSESMAASFGVGVEFLDRELSRFIAAGRIHAKIDKIHGIIETNRPDVKNAQYTSLLTQGDGLLNSIQALARMLSV